MRPAINHREIGLMPAITPCSHCGGTANKAPLAASCNKCADEFERTGDWPNNDLASRATNGNGHTRAAGPFPLTDFGNAERLVGAHGHHIRHVAAMGWFVWDGRRWAPDDAGELQRRAKNTARALYHDAGNCDDDAERKRILTWARASESEPRLRAMVNLAASERAVVARASEMDPDPYSLNVLNGTINLHTGELEPHNPTRLITKLAPVIYDPYARSERWEKFLTRITGNDPDLLAFLQRLAGYTITGVTDEEILAFLHGPGATGKTTTVEAIKAALGDYAATSDFETFLARHGDGGIRNDVARLAGARMVVSVEVEDGKRLAEGLIKQLTGGDKIAARFLHKEFFEFQPQFTLWLVANARPRAHAGDDALWRRILQVPFTVVIPPDERDPDLKRALRTDPTEQAAVLAWLVQGCLDWQRNGLQVPDRVRNYTDEYRAENDPLGEWITEECRLADDHWTPARELRDAYELWCQEAGAKPLDAGRTWSAVLKAHGCSRQRRHGGHGWQGISLQTVTRDPS
jgi:putative DNA primase/helicase